MKQRKERIQVNKKFVIDYNVLADLKSGGRIFPFVLNPIKQVDFEGGKLKLKEGMRIIELEDIWKIGGGEEKGLLDKQ